MLDDVPPASLYRHVKKLVVANVIRSIEERRVRSVTEAVYQIAAHGTNIDPRDLSQLTPSDHLRYFTTFVATLLTDFARYLERKSIDPVRDGIGYRQVPLDLSDDEFRHFVAALNGAILPFLANGPAPNRTRRMFTTIVMPSDVPHTTQDDER